MSNGDDGFLSGLQQSTGLNIGAYLPAGTQATTEPQVFWGYTATRRPVTKKEQLEVARRYGQEYLTVAAQLREPKAIPGLPTPPQPPPGVAKPRVRTVQKEEFRTLSQAKSDIYSWTPQQLEELGDQLVAAGLLPPSYSRAELITTWQDLVQRSSDSLAAGQKMTPWDMLAFMGGGPGAGPYGPRTFTTRSVTISTPEQARAVLEQSLGSLLGRRPSEAELDSFQANLNAAQRAQPTVTTTHQVGGDSTVSTTGGVDAYAYAGQWAERQLGEQIDDYQVAAMYVPGFLDAIESPVS